MARRSDEPADARATMRPLLALVTEIVDWLRPAFDVAGYAIVSGAMFLESAALVGVIVPGDVILAVGGVYAASGVLSLPWVMALGATCALLGETTGYVLGRRYGESLLARLPLPHRFRTRIDRARASLQRNGGKAIVIGRFATGIAGTVPFVAGTSGVDAKTFFLFTVPTVTAWAIAVVLVGYLVGNHVETIDRILSTAGFVGLGVIVLVVAGAWWFRRRRRSADARR